MYEDLQLNLDGSYTFIKNGLPYNCPNFGDWANEFASVDAYAKEHPEQVTLQKPSVKTLDEYKNELLCEIDSSFYDRVSGYITTTEGYKMQFSPDDSIKMQGAIMVLEASGMTNGYLTQYDDTTIRNIPIETMRSVMLQMIKAYAECHNAKQVFRELVYNATSKNELDQINISWPV